MAFVPNYNNSYYQPQQVFYPQSGAVSDMLMQYKTPYQQQPYQMANPVPPPQQPQAQQNSDIIWVQGEAGAKAYLVAPNNTVTLWDSENSTIYIKSADASGVPSLRILDWVERREDEKRTTQAHSCQCHENFVSKNDFKEIEDRVNSLQEEVSKLLAGAKAKQTKQVKEEEAK